ncbi:exo-alpha-sialidase [Streptomyces sp. MBT49]|uniref:LamG-like jellyroll fold domain-containing protein n=1 Tax=Streptomyces sp. MBT49 TaxID=1488380 RepID=UPI0019098CA0|nr:LamG-like jellyroll fold domain-containing protein [Streptomyces sp. MBT49]MBK3626591.1 exo-alpha-sialidase [Streptomyces sp. MBT49]
MSRSRMRALGALLVTLPLLLLAVVAQPAAAGGTQPSADGLIGTEQVLLRSGTAGYGCFRIPTVVRTKAGTLLAFAEARRSPSCADRGAIDIVVRRSTNGGRTWGPVRVVLAGSDTDAETPYTRGNPSPVADLRTGDVHLLSTSEPAEPGGKRLARIQHSTDDGLTFGAPKPLPRLSDPQDGWFGTGPSHGIQLERGDRPGRLVVGAYESPPRPGQDPQLVGVLYSDDGDTWFPSTTADSAGPGMSPGEPSVAELDNGHVYINARNNNGTSSGHRTHAVSTDAGATVPAQQVVPSLTTPEVQASVLALERTYRSTPGDTLVLSAPAHATDRQDMRIRYSTDRGTTWHAAAQVSAARAGYSDLVELTDGEIGLVYEGGEGFSAANVYFNRFTPAQAGVPGTFTGAVHPQASHAPGRTTPDVTPDADDAYLAGSSALGTGRWGQGLALDAAGEYADVPYTPGTDPGDGDFTCSLFFRYRAQAGDTQQRVLMWGYGYGSAKPQVWMRAQPGQDRLYAWVQGAGGTASVPLPDPGPSTAFGDDAWHHLTLVRSGGRITLSVDGAFSAQATGVAGPVTADRADGVDGIRLGAKPDAAAGEPFGGGLDEFRLYREALTDTELAGLRTANAAPSADGSLGVRLPFQVVDTADVPALTSVAIEDDVSGHCADGTLLGGVPGEVAGRVGKGAISVSASRPGVEVPHLPALDVGSGDFTYTLWFRHTLTATDPNAALLWAYGSVSGEPSLWVRAQPAQRRLLAWAETPAGAVQVALADTGASAAFGDGAWHLLAVTRSGGTLRLSVDATRTAEATGLSGALTSAATPQGLRVGSKPGTLDVFTGSLDEVRLHKRALTTDELTRVAQSAVGSTGGYPADRPAVAWSMENGHTEAHQVVRPAPGPATPDSSAHCNHAFVRGGARAVAGGGRFGAGLVLDGTDDSVELPYGADEVLGSRDFTVATWLRYTADGSSGDQVLFWAYGVGGSERQLWLRAQPGQDRLAAVLQTDAAATTVYLGDGGASHAFGDGAWHHVVLQRSGGKLSLSVDGGPPGEAAAPAGSVTYDDGFAVLGLHLGARPDGQDRLKGSLDEFRLVRRALTVEELTALRTSDADTGTATTVRLPFETLSPQPYARM